MLSFKDPQTKKTLAALVTAGTHKTTTSHSDAALLRICLLITC
jgi:hypothetical protein